MSKADCPIEGRMTADQVADAAREADIAAVLALGPAEVYSSLGILWRERDAARAELAEKNAELARLRECVRLADEMLRSAVWTLKYDFITDGAQRTALQDVVNAYRAARGIR